MPATAAARQRDFELPSLKVSALEWGPPTGRPVLALHGWLDNAGSFNLLAPLLPDCRLIALDSPGHGLSSNRADGAGYNIWQDLSEIVEVAEQLGWQRFSLLGHSRGGAVSMLFASSFPERVDRLALIEGGVPMLGEASDAPATLAKAVMQSRALRSKSGRVFPDRESAIAERADGFTKISVAAAEMLAERSLRKVDAGWQWHADQALKGTSEIKLTPELVRAFINAISAPAQIYLADESIFDRAAIYLELFEAFPEAQLYRLPGGHHLHMEGAEAAIAETLAPFLAGS